MKFPVVAIAILGVVAADVSHLNNMYLPPVLGGLATKQQVSYAQESYILPQVSINELVDNSVAEDAAAQEEAQKSSGQLVVEKVQFGDEGIGGHALAALAHHMHTAAAVAHQVQAHAAETIAANVGSESQEAYQSNQQQAIYNNQISQQQEPAQIYYTGLEYQQGQEEVQSADVVAPEIKSEVVAAQHDAYYGQDEHQNIQQPQKKQQIANYDQQFTGVSESSSSSAYTSSGIDTQYAANGGYVY